MTLKINDRSYKLTRKIPSGYSVWYIGEFMGTDKYIPLCCPLDDPNESKLLIDETKLKAIRLRKKNVMLLRDAASYGADNLEHAQEIINHFDETTSTSSFKWEQYNIAKTALPLLKRLTARTGG